MDWRRRCQPIEDEREPLDLSRLSQESRKKSAARSIQLRFFRRWSVELLITCNDATVVSKDHQQAKSKRGPLFVPEPYRQTFGRLTNPGGKDSGVRSSVPQPGRIAKICRIFGSAHIRLVFVYRKLYENIRHVNPRAS